MKKHPLLFLILFTVITLGDLILSPICYANTITDSGKISHTSILLLGDSVSASYGMKEKQGWVNIVNQQLAKQNASYSINNASVSGETTSGGLSRLPAILENQKVDHLLIELGGNDGLRGYSPSLIKNNLLQMIDMAEQKNIPVTLYQIQITPNYGPRYNKLFQKVFLDVAKEKQVKLLPFFVVPVATDETLMQPDGIHPNAKAQPIIAKFVYKQLQDIMIK